jgi:hypothetical protein
MRRLLVVFIMAFTALPSLSSADARQFVPRIMDYYGELAVDARYENNESTMNGQKVLLKDIIFLEKLNLYTLGYVYHPNFITFRLNLSAGLREEKFTSTFSDAPMSVDPITEYEFRMFVLPTHPYNLELFSVRRTPLTRAVLNGVRPVSTSYGATLKYDKQPYGASVSYSHQTTEASSATTESQTLSANGSWFIGFMSTVLGYQHMDSTTSFNETNSNNNSYFRNRIEVKRITLTSEAYLNEQAQEGDQLVSLNLKSWQWEERLDVKLPWNFEASLDYLYYKDTTKTGNDPEVEVKSHQTRFEISRQFYASLRARYSFTSSVFDYDQGDTSNTFNSFNLSYTKRIPFGMLRAGVDYNLTHTDRTGQSVVTNETHTASAIGTDTFTLNNPGAEASSIVIMVSTVVPPGDVPVLVELQQGVNYLVTRSGNTFIITILSVPSGICQTTDCLDPAFEYTFRVSYSTPPTDTSFDTTFYGFNMRLELLKSLINPYFSYYRTKQNVISGSLNGIAEDSTNMTAGLQIQKLPFIFLVEYQDITSNTNPSTAVRSELDYRKDLTPTLLIYGKLNYSNTKYSQGQSGTSLAYTETIYSADAQLQKTFYSPRLTAVLGLSYTHSNGLASTNTYALNTGLTLRTGRTDIIFSGRASQSDVQGNSVKQKLLSEYFFLTFRRKIF